jgi:3-oxoacyl-[acyl-carrier protein] reductase
MAVKKMNEHPLKDKVAVVTGAGRGIGKAIAIAYAKAGASVVCAARTRQEIGQTVEIITGNKGKAIAVQTDVTDISSVHHLFQMAQNEYGGIDILVVNAGGNYDYCSIEKSDISNWQMTISVNLIGAYYCAKEAIPYLKARGGGKIITIGSGLGHRGAMERSAYACSKAGLWMLTRVLAQELLTENISVNELIPGPVETSMDKQRLLSPGQDLLFEGEWLKKPEDIVGLALFMALQPDHGPTAQSYSLMRRDN